MDIYLRLMNLPDGCEMRHLNGKKIKVWHYNLHPSSSQLSINGYDNYCPMCFEGKMLSIKLLSTLQHTQKMNLIEDCLTLVKP